MRKIFEAADAQPDADDICFVSDGCTALQIAALYPPLTEQEEQELLSTRGTPGWESARERLVLCNLRLVMWVANRYPESGGFTTEDLIEYGIVGLMLGIDRYQASQETKLSTYVIPWIQKTIREQVMLRQGLITVPAHMAGQVAKLQKERHRMIAEGILEPSMEELMARSGIDPSMSEQLQSAMEASMCGSLDTPVASGSSRGSSDTATTVGDFIADQKKSTEETAVDAAWWQISCVTWSALRIPNSVLSVSVLESTTGCRKPSRNAVRSLAARRNAADRCICAPSVNYRLRSRRHPLQMLDKTGSFPYGKDLFFILQL